MKRSHIWRGVALAACLALIAGVTACASDNGNGGQADTVEEGESGMITLVLQSREIPYFRDLAAGVEAEVQDQGWEVDTLFGDYTPETQINQIETAITQQPDGMVVGPVDQEALIPAYRSASEAGVPIATVSDNIGDDGLEYQLSYVGHAYQDLGRDKAEFLVNELEGEGTVGVIRGLRGANFTEEQAIGSDEAFAEHEGIEVVEGPYAGGYTPEQGLTATENLLTREPDLDALYYDNDDLALGGIQAFEQRGVEFDDIVIVGTDGGAPALQAVRRGELDATFSLCGYAQGVQAVRTLIQYNRTGEEPPAFIETPQIQFTTENIDEQLEGLTTEDCNAAVEGG